MSKLDLTRALKMKGLGVGEIESLRGPGFRWDLPPPPSGVDYTYSETMTVASSGGLEGWRASKFGTLSDRNWEGYNWDRIFTRSYEGEGSVYAKFSADLQFFSYTSLWFKFGTQDFLEMLWNGTAYTLDTSVDLLPLADYMISEVGNTIPIVIEARS